MTNFNVGVWGSSGYAGKELVKILGSHPDIQSIYTPDRDEASKPTEQVDTAFLALPHGESAGIAARLLHLKAAGRIIDLSGDLRFPTASDYENCYKQTHPNPELLPVPYGLPEFFRDDLTDADIVSMPGCYPTAVLLGLLPLARRGLIDPECTIHIDGLSGVSGSGKKLTEQTHFYELVGDAVPYKVGEHPHSDEMKLILGCKNRPFFSPTLLSVETGMLTKSTFEIDENTTSPSDIYDTLEEFYASEPFVTVLPYQEVPSLKETVRTDNCHIGIVVVGSTVQIISSLDNLRKGAAGQAVQVFNAMNDLPETRALIL